MKIGLNVAERLTLMGLLPKEGNFVTLKIIRNLSEKVGISQEEYIKFEIQEDPEANRVKWGPEGNKDVELEFGEKEGDIISDSLRELNDSKKLEQAHFTLYEKFVTNT